MEQRGRYRPLRSNRLAWFGGLAALGLVAFFGLRALHAGAEVDFNHDVRPLLNERCATCHGGVRREGGLSLLFRSDALDTTESGRRAIVPGDPGASELLRRVGHHDPEERMPPEGPPLSDDEVATLRRWIAQGAPWADHWAYVAPQPVALPPVSDAAWPIRDLDRFVLARLDAEKLRPSPRADCAVLLRRVSLDLVGLPPAPEEVDAFCREPSQAAYEQAVDRLLASPRFGERWAAMWLDLARYADSQGYEKDMHRTIWRYRDWLIDAFNRDLPFDRFTIEQLAGDLLPGATEAQRVATAFHRNTMTNDEGGTDDEEFRVAAVLDRVNTTWEVWQGTTMSCVQCHGHPYDPFRHEDYYGAFAFFNNTADVDRTDEYPTLVSFPDTLDGAARQEGQALLDAVAAVEAEIEAKAAAPETAAALRDWTTRLAAYARDAGRSPTFEDRTVPRDVLRIAAMDDAMRDPAGEARLREYYASYAPAFEALRARRAKLQAELRSYGPVQTPVLRELPEDRRRITRLFDRGNFLTPGEAVAPAVPASLPALPEEAAPDRLGFARWLVSDANPLTARVTVNRFWAQLFGTGIVETLEDFGTQGEAPSHPELLDGLALRFMNEHGWSVKALLREIVTSATYQQASTLTPEGRAKDPRNRLLARGPRVRLTAEQVRDQALAASGLLSDKMYGPSVMPPQPAGLWQAPYNSADWVTSEGEDRYRRAVYTYWRRTVPYPSMLAFDAPSREVCVSRRMPTNTPLQALVTLNDPVYVEAAHALARRMQAEAGSALDDRLAHGYRLVLLRPPAAPALAELRALYDEALAHYRTAPDDAGALLQVGALEAAGAAAETAALTVVANAILNLDEVMVKG